MSVKARVKLTVEIDVIDSWDFDCRVEQIYRQATESAIQAIMKGVIINTMSMSNKANTVARLIGVPEVEAIFYKMDK